MTGEDNLDDPPDLGEWGSIDPTDDRIHFLEDPLSRAKVDAVRPFDQAKSDGGGQPIRVVVSHDGNIFIMQGNHRVYGAREDGIRTIGVLIYSPERWEASFEIRSDRAGNNNPGSF